MKQNQLNKNKINPKKTYMCKISNLLSVEISQIKIRSNYINKKWRVIIEKVLKIVLDILYILYI